METSLDFCEKRAVTWGMKTACKFFLGGLLVLSALSTEATASIDMFLQLDGIEGEATDTAHPNTIQLLSFSANVFQQGLNLAGNGAAAGKAQFNPIEVMKSIDKTSPALFVACATGKHIKTATLFVRNGEATFDYFKIVLTDVLISSLSTSGGSGDDLVAEHVTLSFSKIQWVFTPVNLEGRPDQPGQRRLRC